jgi:hypothetical protein
MVNNNNHNHNKKKKSLATVCTTATALHSDQPVAVDTEVSGEGGRQPLLSSDGTTVAVDDPLRPVNHSDSTLADRHCETRENDSSSGRTSARQSPSSPVQKQKYFDVDRTTAAVASPPRVSTASVTPTGSVDANDVDTAASTDTASQSQSQSQSLWQTLPEDEGRSDPSKQSQEPKDYQPQIQWKPQPENQQEKSLLPSRLQREALQQVMTQGDSFSALAQEAVEKQLVALATLSVDLFLFDVTVFTEQLFADSWFLSWLLALCHLCLALLRWWIRSWLHASLWIMFLPIRGFEVSVRLFLRMSFEILSLVLPNMQ